MDNTGNKSAIISVSESVYDYKSKMNGGDDGIKKMKVKKGFYCDVCEYSTIRKSSMDNHLISKKHKEEILRMGNDGTGKGYEMFKCKCGSSYTHVSSLSRHKRTCGASIEDENNKKMCDVVLGVVQKQSEIIGNLQNQVLELTKASITAATAATAASMNHSNNNSNNNIKHKHKTMGNTNNNCGNFNINIFLNEQCKDAINLSDFVKSLEITFENLKIVNNDNAGMEDSVSSLILKGLENMDVCKRPIHCTDQKRDVMYVKEEEKWEKDEGNDKLKNSIDDISRRHAYTLKKFKDANPDIKVGHAMHDDFIQTMNRVCTPIEDAGKKRVVKKVGKNVAMNAQIANDNDDDDDRDHELLHSITV